jgi:transposase
LADPAVPFTNNWAERALRMAKVHMKIVGCFCTRDGAEHFVLLRGLVETARQREWNLLDFLGLDPDAAVLPQPP